MIPGTTMPYLDDVHRRRRRLHISRKLMLDILAGRAWLDFAGADLPPDVALVEVVNVPQSLGFELFLWSYAFEMVEPGDQVPEMSTLIARYRDAQPVKSARPDSDDPAA